MENPIQPPFSYGFPMVFPWFSYGFPMVFPWFSHGFPMVFPWFSHGFPMAIFGAFLPIPGACKPWPLGAGKVHQVQAPCETLPPLRTLRTAGVALHDLKNGTARTTGEHGIKMA